MNNTGKILIGITAGAAVGAMMGIMFAPDKGSSTRQRWFSKGREYLDEAQNRIDELRGTARDMKEDAQEFVKREKEKAEKAKRDVNSPMM